MRTAKVERKTEYFPILGGEIKATNDAQGIIEGYLNYISRAGVSYTHPSKWARCASKAWDIRRCKSST